MSHTMDDFPSQRAVFKFCFPDTLLSRVGGYSRKICMKQLMLSIFSETR